jgi:RNA polymerase sigma factor (sigma-70 family)
MQLNTPSLMTAFSRGDREAYASLVVRFEGLVRTACRRQAPPAEIEDCVQAVFMVLERRPAAAARAPVLEAWLLRVCGLVCRQAQRAARRRRQAESAAAEVVAKATEITEPEALLHLDDCLDELPERQRLAVVMCYLSGYDANEVAERLNTTHANARQLVSRGLARLRELFARRGISASATGLLAVLAQQAQAAEPLLTASLIPSLLTSNPSSAASHLSQATVRTMLYKTYAPLIAAIILPGVLTTAYFAAEKTGVPAPVITRSADLGTVDHADVRIHKAYRDGNDVVLAVSYAVPAGSAAGIEIGFEERQGHIFVGHDGKARPTPPGRDAFVYRIPASGRWERDRGRSTIVKAWLTPSVRDDSRGSRASSQIILNPAWTAQPVSLTWASTPLDVAIQQLAAQSGIVIQLSDPEHRAAAIPLSITVKDLPFADVMTIIERLSGARSQLMDGEAKRYQLTVPTIRPSPPAGDMNDHVDASSVRIREARWQGDQLTVEIDYQLKEASGAKLSFAFQDHKDNGHTQLKVEPAVRGTHLAERFRLDATALGLSSRVREQAISLSIMLLSADLEIFAGDEFRIPPASQCRALNLELHETSLAAAIQQLGKASGTEFILDDPQHLAETRHLTLKADDRPMFDILAVIELLSGAIIHESGSKLIVTIPDVPRREADPASPDIKIPATKSEF